MKVKVYDFRNVDNNYWVNGVVTTHKDNKFKDELITLRVDKNLYESSIELPIKYPFVLDVKFEKGVGIKAIKQL